MGKKTGRTTKAAGEFLPLEKLFDNLGARHRNVIRSLARKPSPALLHAHDVGEPIEYYADYVWHSLEKEKAFQIEERGKLGVLNCNTDISYMIGFGTDGEEPVFEAIPEVLVHNVDSLVEDVRIAKAEYSWLKARICFLPVTSHGLVARVEVTNAGAFGKALRVYSVFHRTPKRPRNRYQREYYHSYGLVRRTTFTSAGELLKANRDEKNGTMYLHFDEHKPRTSQAIGKIACGMMACGGADGYVFGESLRKLETRERKAPKVSGCMSECTLAPGETRVFRYAVGFQRYGAKEESLHIPGIDEREAIARLGRGLSGLAAFNDASHVEKSIRAVSKYPDVDMPEKDYIPAMVTSLEMPRASTYNATGTMKRPFYNFCRLNSAELYDWWSYGQHAHESIGLINGAMLDARMTGELVLNHFDLQRPDGKVPYGVRQKGAMDLAEGTMPILGWIGWNTYLWSGDKVFLRALFDGCSRYHRWWMENRTDGRSVLCNWLTPHETVRDIAAMPVWKEVPMKDFLAPDVNACLLREEELLAEMAEELGDEDSRGRFSRIAATRRKLMNELMWDGDGCYYGIERGTNRKVRIKDIGALMPLWAGAPTRERAARMGELIDDPGEFRSEFPVTTLAKSDGHFGRNVAMKEKENWANAQGASPCMGDNWPELTYMIVEGLERYGMHELAGDIAFRNTRMVFEDLIRTSHFREHYDSISGFGTGLYDYMWSSIASAFLIRFVYGVRPEKDGLVIRPELPEGWNDATIKGLNVRGKAVDLHVEKTGGKRRAEAGGKTERIGGRRELLLQWDRIKDGITVRYEY